MPSSFLRHAALGSVFALLAGGCGSDPAPSNPSPTSNDAATGIGCERDPRVATFASGMQAKSTSGRFVVEVVDASPAPPQRGAGQAGVNTWTVRATLDGETPTVPITVKTLMPDHGHGSPRAPSITANADGTLTVSDLFLFMGGVWEITFAVEREEWATFTLCID